MYIQGRTVQKWANLIKSFQDEVHFLAGLHFSRLTVSILLCPEKLASKQMHFTSTITLIDDRPQVI